MKKVLGRAVASKTPMVCVPDAGMVLIFSMHPLPKGVCVIGCDRECAQNEKSAPGRKRFLIYSNTLDVVLAPVVGIEPTTN